MDGDEQNDLIKQFYPASVLETGHDIIFFWVIRMLLF
jgi:valyl-tRNA synthetase